MRMIVHEQPDAPLVLEFREFRLDLNLRRLYRNSEPVKLTPTPFATLELLILNRHRVVSREELLEKVWGGQREPSTVEKAVQQLRRTFGDDASNPQYIETVPGEGYRFIAPVDPAPIAEPAKVPRRALIAAAATTAVAGIGFAAFQILRPRPQPERAVLTGNLLTALDGLGRPLWTHRFAGVPREPPYPGPWRIQVLDLQGNGPGVLVARNFEEPGSSRTREELSYFDSGGKLEWTLPCDPELLDCNGKRFEPAWGYSSVVAIPAHGGQTLWAGVIHKTRFPGCVLQVNAHGESRMRLANSGQVQSLCRLHSPDGEYIVFSGVNNGVDQTCVGLIGTNDPPCASPSLGEPRYRYANAPGGLPRHYILLPTVELMTAIDAPYGHAYPTDFDGSRITVLVHVGDKANLLYEFSAQLAPDVVMPDGSYTVLHRRLEEQGILKHPWSQCPELAKPLTLRHFTSEDGWRDEKIPWRLPTNTI